MSKQLIILFFIIILASFLRFYKLESNPPSPYWEEAALGYDAYSILKTGKDHHGNAFPLVAFESFGDWKPSLYFYTAVPSIALFGLNPFAVRIPSAVSGVLTVLLVFLLTKALVRGNNKLTQKIWFPLLAAFFVAVVPWHVLISRVGFETNVGLLLLIGGVWLFIEGVNRLPGLKAGLWLLLGTLCWGLSLYAYHSNRVVVPLLGLGLGLLFLKKFWQNKMLTIVCIVLFLAISFPVFSKLNQPEIAHRFAETSAFTTLDPIIESNAAIAADSNSLFARLIHHRYWYYGHIFATNYLSHFSPSFLFISGDENQRHALGLVGELYWIQFPLIILGLFYLFYRKAWNLLPVLLLLIISPVAAGLTKATPHALRALPLVIPLCMLSAYGMTELIREISSFKGRFVRVLPVPMLVTIGYLLFTLWTILEITRFWHYDQHYYPKESSQNWQYGYKEMINYIVTHQNEYDQIQVTREQGRPAMYYWFYTKADPRSVQEWAKVAPKDQGEILQYDKLYFGITPPNPGRRLYVSTTEIPELQLKDKITFLNGKTAFLIYE